MLKLERAQTGGLDVRAFCKACGGLEIVNPAAAYVAYRKNGEVKPLLIHGDCVQQHKKTHPGEYRYLKVSKVFGQLID